MILLNVSVQYLPSRWNAIDDRVEKGEYAVSLEVASLRHCTTDNSCCGRGEGQLEKESSKDGTHQAVTYLYEARKGE